MELIGARSVSRDRQREGGETCDDKRRGKEAKYEARGLKGTNFSQRERESGRELNSVVYREKREAV